MTRRSRIVIGVLALLMSTLLLGISGQITTAFAKTSSVSSCFDGGNVEERLANVQQVLGSWIVSVDIYGWYTRHQDETEEFCGLMQGFYSVMPASTFITDDTTISWKRTLCQAIQQTYQCSSEPGEVGSGADYLHDGFDGPLSASSLEEAVTATVTDLLTGDWVTLIVDTGVVTAPPTHPAPGPSGGL